MYSVRSSVSSVLYNLKKKSNLQMTGGCEFARLFYKNHPPGFYSLIEF